MNRDLAFWRCRRDRLKAIIRGRRKQLRRLQRRPLSSHRKHRQLHLEIREAEAIVRLAITMRELRKHIHGE